MQEASNRGSLCRIITHSSGITTKCCRNRRPYEELSKYCSVIKISVWPVTRYFPAPLRTGRIKISTKLVQITATRTGQKGYHHRTEMNKKIYRIGKSPLTAESKKNGYTEYDLAEMTINPIQLPQKKARVSKEGGISSRNRDRMVTRSPSPRMISDDDEDTRFIPTPPSSSTDFSSDRKDVIRLSNFAPAPPLIHGFDGHQPATMQEASNRGSLCRIITHSSGITTKCCRNRRPYEELSKYCSVIKISVWPVTRYFPAPLRTGRIKISTKLVQITATRTGQKGYHHRTEMNKKIYRIGKSPLTAESKKNGYTEYDLAEMTINPIV
ncbi:hypothetical protein PRIPAC_91924 [Pristionchus pacificus]|uniref:Ribosomal protein n=1 Tax=Pristionchus pacificus TaxID=54126 RepID=A0A2A6BPJ8_PRIPA|nr:hypothetical protein PRIPAC_91924 [Pristionchus pacificus]|eukprot:PDM67839.1 ribosomal protein [Pristionchus pacificus]